MQLSVITAIKTFHRFLFFFFLSLILETIFKTLLQRSGGIGSHIPFADKKAALLRYLQSQESDPSLAFMHIIAAAKDIVDSLCTRLCTEHLVLLSSFDPHNHL